MNIVRSRPLLLGHRGARSVRSLRENTITSFDRALADGCDGFEFDVRRTADGEALVWHDPECDGKYIEETSADQLPHLARLADVIARYQSSAFLDIELKVAGLEKITADLLRRFPVSQGVVVSSFIPQILEAAHVENPEIPLGLICEHKAGLSHWQHLPIEYVIAHHDLLEQLDRAGIEQLKAAGKKVMVWTVNDAAGMSRFRQMGIDGIISDKTSLLCQTLKA
ncbi:MAG TPA: glycerophosphodiester phosphodiesterase [Terriglobales bacterium]|jgi:glycerophosphoryl diester phosphodiesterase|nr:glycerophosphodiester phosphodiesterase [Terriglobales bacterium]